VAVAAPGQIRAAVVRRGQYAKADASRSRASALSAMEIVWAPTAVSNDLDRRCKMNMPGFTADASVYKTKGCYASTASYGASQMNGAVRLAQGDDCNCDRLSGCARKRCYCECPDADGNSGICVGSCCKFCTWTLKSVDLSTALRPQSAVALGDSEPTKWSERWPKE